MSSLVVIDDLDIKHVAVLECEADTPLVVDAYAPLSFAVSLQGFQPIARRGAHEVQRGCGIELGQLAFGHCLEGSKTLGLPPSNNACVSLQENDLIMTRTVLRSA